MGIKRPGTYTTNVAEVNARSVALTIDRNISFAVSQQTLAPLPYAWVSLSHFSLAVMVQEVVAEMVEECHRKYGVKSAEPTHKNHLA